MTNENVQNDNVVNENIEEQNVAEENVDQTNELPAQGVYVDYEEKMTLEGAATFLDTIVTKLKEGQSFTLTHAGQTFEVNPAQQVGLEIKYEKKKDGKYKLELELEWREGDGGGIQIG